MDSPMSTPPEPVDPKTTRPRIRTLRITMLEHAPTTLRSDPYYDTHTYPFFFTLIANIPENSE